MSRDRRPPDPRRIYTVYALEDGGEVVYFGMTTRPGLRPSEHVRAGKRFDAVVEIASGLTEIEARDLERHARSKHAHMCRALPRYHRPKPSTADRAGGLMLLAMGTLLMARPSW